MLSTLLCYERSYSKSRKDLEEIKRLPTLGELAQNCSRSKVLVGKAQGLQTIVHCGSQTSHLGVLDLRNLGQPDNLRWRTWPSWGIKSRKGEERTVFCALEGRPCRRGSRKFCPPDVSRSKGASWFSSRLST